MRNELGLHMARDQVYPAQNLARLQTPNSAGCVDTRGTWKKTTSVSKINIITNYLITSWINVISSDIDRSK